MNDQTAEARPLRILHLAASHRWTGVAEPAARLAAAEKTLGHDVRFALIRGGSFHQNIEALDVRVEGTFSFDRSYLPHRKLRELAALGRLFDFVQPDIIHSHLTHDHIMAIFARRRCLHKAGALVRTWHREETHQPNAFIQGLIRNNTDGIIAVSHSLKEHLQSAYGMASERIAVIGGMFDENRFQPNRERGLLMREKWGISPDAPVVGLISRLRISRGVAWLLEAAEDALPRVPGAKLVISGRGKYKKEMLRRLESHPAANQIVYVNYLDRDELAPAYNAFDASLLLRPGNDGACRGALEAMACGNPVIGGDVGALKDIIQPGETGWLAPLDDPKALSNAMVEALSNREKDREMGGKAADYVRKHHLPGIIAKETAGFYKKILQSETVR